MTGYIASPISSVMLCIVKAITRERARMRLVDWRAIKDGVRSQKMPSHLGNFLQEIIMAGDESAGSLSNYDAFDPNAYLERYFMDRLC